MVSVSWGSQGEVNASGPCLCVSGGQERHGKGEGRDEDMEREKQNKKKKSGESGRAHTLEHTLWERTIAGKSHLIGRNSYGVIRYF